MWEQNNAQARKPVVSLVLKKFAATNGVWIQKHSIWLFVHYACTITTLTPTQHSFLRNHGNHVIDDTWLEPHRQPIQICFEQDCFLFTSKLSSGSDWTGFSISHYVYLPKGQFANYKFFCSIFQVKFPNHSLVWNRIKTRIAHHRYTVPVNM